VWRVTPSQRSSRPRLRRFRPCCRAMDRIVPWGEWFETWRFGRSSSAATRTTGRCTRGHSSAKRSRVAYAPTSRLRPFGGFDLCMHRLSRGGGRGRRFHQSRRRRRPALGGGGGSRLTLGDEPDRQPDPSMKKYCSHRLPVFIRAKPSGHELPRDGGRRPCSG
jgi:hypothetical protein